MFTRVPMTDNRQTVFMGVPIEDRQAGDHRLAIFTGVAKTDNKQFLWKYRRQKKKKKDTERRQCSRECQRQTTDGVYGNTEDRQATDDRLAVFMGAQKTN